MRKYFSGLLILIPLLTIFIFSNIHCSSASDQTSSSCAQIKKDELLPLLKNLAPDIEILEMGNAPFGGLCEFAVKTRGKKSVIYTDPSAKYVISGAIIDLETKANLTQERLTELNKIDVSQIPLDNAILLGDKDAKHRVIVFTDVECPYCSKLHTSIKDVVQKRDDIAFFVMLYPLPMHKDALRKSKTIACEKSLSLLDDAFAKKPIPDPKCETTAIDDNINLAQELGITGTPAIILSNGILVPGAREADALITLIDKAAE